MIQGLVAQLQAQQAGSAAGQPAAQPAASGSPLFAVPTAMASSSDIGSTATTPVPHGLAQQQQQHVAVHNPLYSDGSARVSEGGDGPASGHGLPHSAVRQNPAFEAMPHSVALPVAAGASDHEAAPAQTAWRRMTREEQTAVLAAAAASGSGAQPPVRHSIAGPGATEAAAAAAQQLHHELDAAPEEVRQMRSQLQHLREAHVDLQHKLDAAGHAHGGALRPPSSPGGAGTGRPRCASGQSSPFRGRFVSHAGGSPAHVHGAARRLSLDGRPGRTSGLGPGLGLLAAGPGAGPSTYAASEAGSDISQRVVELEEEIMTDRNAFAEQLTLLTRANRELDAK